MIQPEAPKESDFEDILQHPLLQPGSAIPRLEMDRATRSKFADLWHRLPKILFSSNLQEKCIGGENSTWGKNGLPKYS